MSNFDTQRVSLRVSNLESTVAGTSDKQNYLTTRPTAAIKADITDTPTVSTCNIDLQRVSVSVESLSLA